MIRGTTPTITYRFSFDATEITAFRMYFMQGKNTVLVKDEHDCIFGEHTVSCALSEEETYLLSAKNRVETKARFLMQSGMVGGTRPRFFDLYDMPVEILADGGADKYLLGTKLIRKNGTYYAEDDGFYGYSMVTVAALQGAIGYKSDGNEYYIYVNEDGELKELLLPSILQIKEEPDKMEYEDGEEIDLSGLEIEMYTADGEPWYGDPDDWEDAGFSFPTWNPSGGNVLPDTVIYLDPEDSYADESEVDEEGMSSDEVDLSPWKKPVPVCDVIHGPYGSSPDYSRPYTITASEGTKLIMIYNGDTSDLWNPKDDINGNGWNYVMAVSKNTPYASWTGIEKGQPVSGGPFGHSSAGSTVYSYTLDGKRVYYREVFYGVSAKYSDATGYWACDFSAEQFAAFQKAMWVAVYGDHVGGTKKINFHWTRPIDGKTLTLPFQIKVTKGVMQ